MPSVVLHKALCICSDFCEECYSSDMSMSLPKRYLAPEAFPDSLKSGRPVPIPNPCLIFLQPSVKKIYKHAEKYKEFYSEHPYICLSLGSVVDILLSLLYHISLHFSICLMFKSN